MILTRFARYLSPVALLLIMLIQMAAASPVQSAAFDEGFHDRKRLALIRRPPELHCAEAEVGYGDAG